MIRAEPLDPTSLINTQHLLANNPQISPKYINDHAQAIAYFEEMERLLGDEYIHACMRRWNTLPHSLQIREYHSPTRMKEALRRVPLYKRSMQSLKVNWVGLKLSPPLLLGMLEGRKEEKEQQQWEEVDRKVRFHDKDEKLTSEAWDVREAIRVVSVGLEPSIGDQKLFACA